MENKPELTLSEPIPQAAITPSKEAFVDMLVDQLQKKIAETITNLDSELQKAQQRQAQLINSKIALQAQKSLVEEMASKLNEYDAMQAREVMKAAELKTRTSIVQQLESQNNTPKE